MSTGIHGTRPRRASFALAFALALASALAGSCSGSAGSIFGRYRASQGAESITLEFHDDQRVTISLATGGGEDELSHECLYTVRGKTVTLTPEEPRGVPLSLTIDGDSLRDPTGFVYEKM